VALSQVHCLPVQVGWYTAHGVLGSSDHWTAKWRDCQCHISVTLPGTGSWTGPDGTGDAHPAATERWQNRSPGMGSEILRQLSHPKRQPGCCPSPHNRLCSASELPRTRARHHLADFSPEGRVSAFPRQCFRVQAEGFWYLCGSRLVTP